MAKLMPSFYHLLVYFCAYCTILRHIDVSFNDHDTMQALALDCIYEVTRIETLYSEKNY